MGSWYEEIIKNQMPLTTNAINYYYMFPRISRVGGSKPLIVTLQLTEFQSRIGEIKRLNRLIIAEFTRL